MLNEEMAQRIRRLKVADLADGCRQLGSPGRVADPSLRPAVPMSRLAGTAVPVRLYLAPGFCDYNLSMARVYDLGRSVPRAVLVQRNDVPGFVSMGSGGATMALAHGYVGCVVNGPVRDTEELPEIGFPLFGTGGFRPDSILVDEAPPGHSIHFELDNPVEVAGVVVAPGDVVVADNDGLIAIHPTQLESVVVEAEKIISLEHSLFAMLKQGMTFADILAARPDLSSVGTHKPGILHEQPARK